MRPAEFSGGLPGETSLRIGPFWIWGRGLKAPLASVSAPRWDHFRLLNCVRKARLTGP